ncbi:MAG: DUF3179 domain-containing protein [Bacteroidetes bacterium]|nr:DUF3179 domain-containing protein [Bacteroidota bacterium]MBP6427242.1 DUF3179 domain-containing protein [Bacteroidia bacterium]
MYRFFYICTIAFLFFEIINCMMVLPLPIKLEFENVSVAYWIYKYRWEIRLELLVGIIFGIFGAYRKSRLSVVILSTLTVVTIFFCNFKYTATKMYRRSAPKLMVNSDTNKVDLDRLIVGMVKNCEARAYPIQFLAYHQRVFDGMCGKRFMMTYCPVTRTAKAYLTDYEGKNDYYRYLGLINNDAIYEDFKTGTWWSQSTGKGIAGKRKGESLREWPCYVTTLRQWLTYNPESLILQPDERYADQYKKNESFEFGEMFEGFEISKRSFKNDGIEISDNYKVSSEEENRLYSKNILLFN